MLTARTAACVAVLALALCVAQCSPPIIACFDDCDDANATSIPHVPALAALPEPAVRTGSALHHAVNARTHHHAPHAKTRSSADLAGLLKRFENETLYEDAVAHRLAVVQQAIELVRIALTTPPMQP